MNARVSSKLLVEVEPLRLGQPSDLVIKGRYASGSDLNSEIGRGRAGERCG